MQTFAHYDYDHFSFESVTEMCDAADAMPMSRRPDLDDRQEWLGRADLPNYAAARRACDQTWDHGLRVVDRMLEQLQDTQIQRPVSRRRRLRWDEAGGDEICYDRLRSGQPFWRESRRQNTKGPTNATILVDIGAQSRISADDMLWRGAAALALTYLLEAADYRVELWAYRHVKNNRWDGWREQAGMISVCLKRTQDPLDISGTVNSVSGWFYRTIFRTCYAMGDKKVDIDGIGQGARALPEQIQQITSDENFINIEGVFAYHAAVKKVTNELARLGLTEPVAT